MPRPMRVIMHEALRRARPALGEAAATTADFLRGRLGPGGGFRGRGKQEDLYYTVFGIEGLVALGEAAPFRSAVYLETQGVGADLDLVHLSCLARCLADLDALTDPAHAEHIASTVERFRSDDGGYAQTAGQASATAYGCYLAYGAYEDLGLQMPQVEAMLAALGQTGSRDGAFANEPGQDHGLTAVTAGIVALCRHLDHPVAPTWLTWLHERVHRDGGFMASPLVPMPDLLSTATALFALREEAAFIDAVRTPCLRFLDAMWSEQGGFKPHYFENNLDTEYTWYGLLSLGLLQS